MNILAVVLLMTQAPIWTVSPPAAFVGDTVRLTRRVSAEPDTRSTVLPLSATEAYIPLAAPIVAYSEGALVIRYQLAFFETGEQAVLMPDIELTYPDGRVHVVSGGTAWVHVGSVLPFIDSLPPPQPSLGPISRVERSLIPAISIVSVFVVLLVAWALWRRRTLPRPVWSGSTAEAVEVPLQQWMIAGESKAVVGAVSDRLRDTIESVLPAAGRHLSTKEFIAVVEKSCPDWPRREIKEVMRSLDRAMYAPAVPSDLALLVDQVENLVKIIHEDSEEESGE
jgi:hypothetical protein